MGRGKSTGRSRSALKGDFASRGTITDRPSAALRTKTESQVPRTKLETLNDFVAVVNQYCGSLKISKCFLADDQASQEQWDKQHPGCLAMFTFKDRSISLSPLYSQILRKISRRESTPEENYAFLHIFTHELMHAKSGLRDLSWSDDAEMLDKITTSYSTLGFFEEGTVEAIARRSIRDIAQEADLAINPAYISSLGLTKPVFTKTGPYPHESRTVVALASLISNEFDAQMIASDLSIEEMPLSPETTNVMLNWLEHPPTIRPDVIGRTIGQVAKSSVAEARKKVRALAKEARDEDYSWLVIPRGFKIGSKEFNCGYKYKPPKKNFNEKLAKTLAQLAS